MPAFTSYAFTRWHLHWMWWRTSNCSSLLIYRPRQDERLSWPGWLTYTGRLTHISGHPSATGRAQDGERTLARDWRSTDEPRGPTHCVYACSFLQELLRFLCGWLYTVLVWCSVLVVFVKWLAWRTISKMTSIVLSGTFLADLWTIYYELCF